MPGRCEGSGSCPGTRANEAPGPSLATPPIFDVATLDPPGVNQGLARFGISDF